MAGKLALLMDFELGLDDARRLAMGDPELARHNIDNYVAFILKKPDPLDLPPPYVSPPPYVRPPYVRPPYEQLPPYSEHDRKDYGTSDFPRLSM